MIAYGKGRGCCRRRIMSDSYKKYSAPLALSYKLPAARYRKKSMRPEGLGAYRNEFLNSKAARLHSGPPFFMARHI